MYGVPVLYQLNTCLKQCIHRVKGDAFNAHTKHTASLYEIRNHLFTQTLRLVCAKKRLCFMLLVSCAILLVSGCARPDRCQVLLDNPESCSDKVEITLLADGVTRPLLARSVKKIKVTLSKEIAWDRVNVAFVGGEHYQKMIKNRREFESFTFEWTVPDIYATGRLIVEAKDRRGRWHMNISHKEKPFRISRYLDGYRY